jgi:D-lactate dehydrogenase
MQMPNVLITPHQAFATQEALGNIASTTFASFNTWAVDGVAEHELTFRKASERLLS